MHHFSGIRAETRRRTGSQWRSRGGALSPLFRGRLATVLVVAALLSGGRAEASGGHDPAPAPAAPAAAEPPPPPPPKPRPPPPPPPKLDGPIAAEAPKPRIEWLADPFTGFALGGYDPVAYWTEGRPVLGQAAFEFAWQGTTWRFANVGNLAAFRAAPEVYAPLFAGRCAFAVSQGRPTEGSPLFPAFVGGRLLLFADATARAAFMLAPDRLLSTAIGRWPELAADLP
jgi:hypothetical protein